MSVSWNFDNVKNKYNARQSVYFPPLTTGFYCNHNLMCHLFFRDQSGMKNEQTLGNRRTFKYKCDVHKQNKAELTAWSVIHAVYFALKLEGL
jgi:5-methylcytosine-specific restriction endonuclease McrA